MNNPDRPAVAQRREVRFSTFGFVEICDELGESLSSATVRELSQKGAHLRLRVSTILPKRLLITWPNKQLSRTATVIWINGASIGIEFDGQIEL
jgi:hypothetical protein